MGTIVSTVDKFVGAQRTEDAMLRAIQELSNRMRKSSDDNLPGYISVLWDDWRSGGQVKGVFLFRAGGSDKPSPT